MFLLSCHCRMSLTTTMIFEYLVRWLTCREDGIIITAGAQFQIQKKDSFSSHWNFCLNVKLMFYIYV